MEIKTENMTMKITSKNRFIVKSIFLMAIIAFMLLLYNSLNYKLAMVVSSVCFFIGVFVSVFTFTSHKNLFLPLMLVFYLFANSQGIISHNFQHTEINFYLWLFANFFSLLFVIFQVDFRAFHKNNKV